MLDVRGACNSPIGFQHRAQEGYIEHKVVRMDAAKYSKLAKSIVDETTARDAKLDFEKVLSDVKPGYLRSILPQAPPLHAEPFEAIRSDMQTKILPGLTHWASPRFMAYFPCGTSYPAALAEMYSQALNGAFFNWACSPAATELEMVVLDWLAQALALPECFLSSGSTGGGGVIHSSATEAILVTMTAARARYLAARTAHLADGEAREEEKYRIASKLVAVGSVQVHSSSEKAARISGVRYAKVPVSRSNGYSMQGIDLQMKLAQLRERGLEPFYVTATLGTTDLCAVDDFQGIAKVANNQAEARPLWVHVDAAYAGSALLLAEFQPIAETFRHFRSFNVSPHKWMLTTNDCSTTFVRCSDDLTSALRVERPYLAQDTAGRGPVTDYHEWQLSLGRRFRSLKLWFVLRSYGITGLQRHITRGIKLAIELERMLRSRSDLFSVFTRAQFALLSLEVNGGSQNECNLLTKELYAHVNSRRDFFLTSTVVDGHYVIRVCTGGAAVELQHVRELFDLLLATTERLRGMTGAFARDEGYGDDVGRVFGSTAQEVVI